MRSFMFRNQQQRNGTEQQQDFGFVKRSLPAGLSTSFDNSSSLMDNDFQLNFNSVMDLSFDHGLQRENAQLIWKASINYLQETIKESVEEMSGFMNDKKQEFLGERETSDKEIPDMIMANRLLNKGDRETFIVYLNQEPDMYNLLKEIKDMFGSDICEQLFYIIFHLLQNKYQSFKTNMTKDTQLPHFNCFWGQDENLQVFASSCPVYDDITTEEVIDEAVKNVEEVADKMYDDESIKILNLNVMKESILEGVNPRANFIELIVAISKAVFLTIAGQTVVTKDLDQSFDISQDIQEKDIVGETRKYTRERPVPLSGEGKEEYETVYYESILKRVKFV